MKIWRFAAGEAHECQSVWGALGLSEASVPCVIAIIGSGGKTSLMGRLALEGMERKLRVAVLTTTHIRKPPRYREVFCDILPGEAVVFGTDAGNGKLGFPGEECFRRICRHADLVLVEADGSRGLPLKAPGPSEPVIPLQANRIITVCGLSGLGKPGSEVCHRWENALELLEKRHIKGLVESVEELRKNRAITEEETAVLLEQGYRIPLTRKYPNAEFCYCLNQADHEEARKHAVRLSDRLGGNCLMTSFFGQRNPLYDPEPFSEKTKTGFGGIAMIYMASGFGSRFGENKLLSPLEGSPLYRHGLECLKAAALLLGDDGIGCRIIVVSQYEEILFYARESGFCTVQNTESAQGITASIRLGVQADAGAQAYLFSVADQPWLCPGTLAKLVREGLRGGKGIACLGTGEKRGNPVLFSQGYRDMLQNLTGDRGGSQIIRQFPEDLMVVQAEEWELFDIDNPQDLKNRPLFL